MFDLAQLRCFIAVAEELHFGRAAQRLNMTQPPLSRQIRILERVLGVELFRRTSRSVRLTPAGRGFLPEARRIHRAIEHAATMVRRHAAGDVGSLSLGFTAASGYGYLPRLIKQVKAGMPEVDLSLHEMVSGDQVEALMAGDLDAGLLRPPFARQAFAAHRVVAEPLWLAVPAGHALAGRGATGFGDLRDTPFVMYSPKGARYFFDLLTARFQAADIAPPMVQYVSQIHSMLALVGAGIGVALVPASAAALHVEGVVLVPFDAPDLLAELYLVWRHGHDNPVLPRLERLIAPLAS